MSGRLATLRFVVIQSDPTDLAALQDLLHRSGAEKVRCFPDLKEATHHLRAAQADLIVCDLDAEPVDGLTFAKLLRGEKMALNRATPLLLTAARIDDPRVAQARQTGPCVVAAKPLDQHSLLRGIGECLKKAA